jgi:hypothetical protein
MNSQEQGLEELIPAGRAKDVIDGTFRGARSSRKVRVRRVRLA